MEQQTFYHRYHTDPKFHALVDLMVGHIEQCNYTPSEMRGAAVLASIISEQCRMRTLSPQIPESLEKGLTILHRLISKYE